MIRPARIDDARSIAGVQLAVGVIAALRGKTIDEVEGYVRQALAGSLQSPAYNAYVAEAESGVVVGYCAVHWDPILFFPAPEGHVTELFILPLASGAGLGTALLEVVIAEARRRNCARLSLLNGRDAESYRRQFYRKRGWKERARMATFIFEIN
jgi:GNAT superfamily N-acetyltransferase